MSKENKPTRKTPRKRISGNLKTQVFQEALVTCPFCGLQKLGSLQVHHIDENPSNDLPENLIAVCGSCHEQITKGIVSNADVCKTKLMLKCGVHPFQAKVKTTQSVNANVGINKGIIANEVTIKSGAKTTGLILQGTIGTDPAKYNYVEYLVKKLTKWRQNGEMFGQKRKGELHDGVTRNILAQQLGGLTKDLLLERFESVVEHIQGKIDDTVFGLNNLRKGIRNYHDFTEHGLPKKKRGRM